jgi:hypothetical protein
VKILFLKIQKGQGRGTGRLRERERERAVVDTLRTLCSGLSRPSQEPNIRSV